MRTQKRAHAACFKEFPVFPTNRKLHWQTTDKTITMRPVQSSRYSCAIRSRLYLWLSNSRVCPQTMQTPAVIVSYCTPLPCSSTILTKRSVNRIDPCCNALHMTALFTVSFLLTKALLASRRGTKPGRPQSHCCFPRPIATLCRHLSLLIIRGRFQH